MATMTTPTLTPEDIERLTQGLWSSAIDVKAIDKDWDTGDGETEPNYTVYEAVECDDCGKISMVSGEERCQNTGDAIGWKLPDGRVLDKDEIETHADDIEEQRDEEHYTECPQCKGEVEREDDDSPDDGDLARYTCTGSAGEEQDSEPCGWQIEVNIPKEFETDGCSNYVSGSGPMMNYAYPLPEFRRRWQAEEAAAKITHLPLCIVEMEGDFYLALTGGGMDLSWEICEAYIALGYLPPTHFSDLPRYAGMDLNKKLPVIAAMLRAIEIQQGWLKSADERVRRLLT